MVNNYVHTGDDDEGDNINKTKRLENFLFVMLRHFILFFLTQYRCNLFGLYEVI